MIDFDTERLQLRALAPQDESLYLDLYCDAETMRFIGPTLSRERAARSFRAVRRQMRLRPEEGVVFAIVEKAGDTAGAIGICSVLGVAGRRAEIGIMMHKASRVRGLATEALTALARRAFTLFPIDEVWCQFAVEHIAVERMVTSSGFSATAPEPAQQAAGLRRWAVRRGGAT